MATPTCPKGQMYDKKAEKCVPAKNHKIKKVELKKVSPKKVTPKKVKLKKVQLEGY